MSHDHFFVRVKHAYRKVPLKAIIYLEAGANEVRLVLEKESMIIRGTLAKVLSMLPPECFCRIHQSYAVAVEKVVSFNSESVVLQDGRQRIELPMGKHHKKLLEEKIWVLGEKV
ncbi:MAG: LytTR family DNA-binding domain-containing protein [Sediminibacterium sp.]